MSGDSLQIKGLEGFSSTTVAWMASVRKAAEEASVGLAKRVFDKVLLESPQYSGDFVANWKVTKGAPAPASDFTAGVIRGRVSGIPDNAGIKESEPFRRGDSEAIEYAKDHARWPTLQLGETLFISNSAEHDTAYAVDIEKGTISFRPVNAGADHVAQRSVQFVANRFGHIGKAQLAVLRRIGV